MTLLVAEHTAVTEFKFKEVRLQKHVGEKETSYRMVKAIQDNYRNLWLSFTRGTTLDGRVRGVLSEGRTFEPKYECRKQLAFC